MYAICGVVDLEPGFVFRLRIEAQIVGNNSKVLFMNL